MSTASKKEILVPIDFSECSKNALINAIEMARQWGFKLHLVHSYLMPAEALVGAEVGNPYGTDTDHSRDVNYNFKKLIKELPELKSVEYVKSLKLGRLSSVINDLAEKNDIELVVMGTHGARGMKELVMGSNTYNVIKNIQLPVMIFPEKSGVLKIKRCAFLSGFENLEDPMAFQPFRDLVKRTNAEIDLIHFIKKDSLRVELVRTNKLILHIGDIRHSVHVSRDAALESDIHDYVLLYDIDLLVMMPKKHHFFEFLYGKEVWSEKLIFHTKTPLFVLPH